MELTGQIFYVYIGLFLYLECIEVFMYYMDYHFKMGNAQNLGNIPFYIIKHLYLLFSTVVLKHLAQDSLLRMRNMLGTLPQVMQ